MALKQVRVLYQSRNFITGLTNVKAQVYLDSAPKLVGANAVLLTELDSSNAPGVYELILSTAQLSTMGGAAGQNLEVVINSATALAEAIFRTTLTEYNTDDLRVALASNDANVASVKSDTAAIKIDLETGPSSLANILAGINQIKANAGFAVTIPAELTRPGSGSMNYRLPLRIYNEANMLLDPDANSIRVTVKNQSGADRGSYLAGYVTGTPGYAPMVRDSLGAYRVDISIPSTATEEELIFEFTYAIGGTATSRVSTSQIINDVDASGFAMQATLLDVQARGLANYNLLTDPTVGLSSANTLQAAIKAQTDKLGDATIGLSAIKSQTDSIKAELLTRVEGTGFDPATDSLRQISIAIGLLAYSGGKAV